jgi:hypothetical protein
MVAELVHPLVVGKQISIIDQIVLLIEQFKLIVKLLVKISGAMECHIISMITVIVEIGAI